MKNIYIVLFLLFSTVLYAEGKVEEPAVIVTEVDEVDATQFIALSTVPQDAAKVLIELKKIEEMLILSEEEKKVKSNMQEEVRPYSEAINLFLSEPKYKDIKEHNTRDLQKMQSEVAVYIKQLTEWEVVLQKKIKLYEKNREVLTQYSKVWTKTHINATKEDAPEAIEKHITSVIIKINELENKIKEKYDLMLTLSQIVITNILKLKEKISTLKEREIFVNKKIFFKNEKSFLRALSEDEFSISLYYTNITVNITEKIDEIYAYFDTHNELYIKLLILFFIGTCFIIYASYLYRKKKLFINEESYLKSHYFYIKNIFSTITILLILLIVAVFPQRPNSLFELQIVVLLIPVLRILQTKVDEEINKYFYVFILLFFIFIVNNNAVGDELEGRIILLLVSVVSLGYLGSIVRKQILSQMQTSILREILKYIVYLSFIVLLIGIIANIYGAVLLSTKIIYLMFAVFFATAIFYVLYTILIGYVVIILRRRISTASYMLEKYSQRIEEATKFLVRIWMLSWWLLVVLKLLGVYPYIISLRDMVLALSWDIAQTTISVQSIVDFILIVIATWFIAKVIRVVLEVEVFSRFKLPRGAPTAILTVLNYIIVISGTVISLSSLGVTSQQFAIVIGALGVGIGFGLRNIIANFVSGIIMVFERPVQIGDVIEVDKTMGSVQSIGARASTLKTFDGSEVIIPNADFIGKEIVNWTLSDEQRRKTLEFKVGLDNDIDKILEIMMEVVLEHPDVLKEPEPLATFKGFGEYTLDFKVYFWLSDNLIVAQSDIAIGIYKELQSEGVKMPIPKTHLQDAYKQ